MNHFKNLYIVLPLLSISLFFSGCKKEIIPPPGSSEPVFKAEGTFNGQEISLHAGDENVLMTTSVQETNGVQFFSGILGNSQVELEMGIFSGNLDLQNQDPDFSGMNQVDFAYLPNQALFTVCKDSLPNASSINKIVWEVNGVTHSELNTLNIYEPGKYNICAHVTFSDYSESTLCNEVIVGFKRNADFYINFFLNQDLSFQSWVSPILGVVKSVTWYQHGAVIGNQNQLYTSVGNAENNIQAEVIFSNGAKVSRNVVIDGSLQGRNIFDFTQNAKNMPLQWDYNAKIKLKKNGVYYYSHKALNNTNKITVSEIKYHGLNPQGKTVYLLKGTIDANLMPSSGTSTFPLHMNVSFGFAVE